MQWSEQTYPEVGRGENGVELPALLDHEGEGPHVLHDLHGDLAAVGHARTLLLVAEEDHVVHLDQAVELPGRKFNAHFDLQRMFSPF